MLYKTKEIVLMDKIPATFLKDSFWNTRRESKGMDPDQARSSVQLIWVQTVCKRLNCQQMTLVFFFGNTRVLNSLHPDQAIHPASQHRNINNNNNNNNNK